jgi:thioredoxin-related protein
LDSNLASKFGITTRPTIVFFAESSDDFHVVPGSFTKDSLITILEENKYGNPSKIKINKIIIKARY